MGVILQVALPSRVLAAARLQCGAAGAGASRGLGVCAEHARLAARGESARAMEIGDFLVWLGPVANSQCVSVWFNPGRSPTLPLHRDLHSRSYRPRALCGPVRAGGSSLERPPPRAGVNLVPLCC
jgi:hypothetical protein